MTEETVEQLKEQIRELKRDYEETNRMLEMRVQFATRGHQIANRKLAEANNKLVNTNAELNRLQEKLAVQNEELQKAMDALWGEMELAHRIQTSLLPPNRKDLAGLEVAGFMKPADDVGGDYYDIIESPSGQWIAIGDVSGHGVSAGLVMMMAQTAIRTAIAQAERRGEKGEKDEISPAKILSTANDVLTNNISLISSDKYMTAVLIYRDPDGVFHYSGLHLDLMIYRAESRSIESIETEGAWLGLIEDIDSDLEVGSFVLHKDDILLLYTDGIIEARRDRKMLENEGLTEAFLSQAQKETNISKILESLCSMMEDYSCQDDMTFVIVKCNN